MSDMSPFRCLTLLLILFICSACSDHGYLMQSINGHFGVLSRTMPIDDVLQNDGLEPEIREQLARAVDLRTFAVRNLSLPDNGSYQHYADLERPYVVWNVVAAPELSLEPYDWCYPVVGCVSYRGYFDEFAAKEAAKHLENIGFDVDVYGVQAYSTLNWFNDPVLNTFLRNDEIRLASLLFHEMAHQVVYVRDDPVFNESFAKTVELEGLRRFYADHHLWVECQKREKHSALFNNYLFDVRSRLGRVYQSDLSNDDKRIRKKALLKSAYEKFGVLKNEHSGLEGYAKWMSRGLNNARLSSIAMYYDYVPAFKEILRLADYDLPTFYRKVKTIAAMDSDDRTAKLKSMMPGLHAARD